jgi:hypothetical protein
MPKNSDWFLTTYCTLCTVRQQNNESVGSYSLHQLHFLLQVQDDLTTTVPSTFFGRMNCYTNNNVEWLSLVWSIWS